MSASDNLHETQFGGADGDEYTAPNGRVYTLVNHSGGGRVEAFTPGGISAGRMAHRGPYSSEPEQQTIGNIQVAAKHRGKGLATAMLDYARKDYPDLHHSQVLTDDGKGFAANTPRTWQPKLPLLPGGGGIEANGGEAGPSPWSGYVDFGPKNKRSRAESDAQIAEAKRLRDRPPTDTGEQMSLPGEYR
jgi:hypothetical protein